MFIQWNEKKKDGKDMNELKQELDMDEHKIPAAELYKRLKTSPEKVNKKKCPSRYRKW